MKPAFTRFSVLIPALILCLVTCKTPVNNKSGKPDDTRWIEELTITQLQKGYKDGKYTVKDVVKVYLDRINEIDKNGPELNSIIVINPDALNIAEEMDKEIAAGKTA
jgi:amidase